MDKVVHPLWSRSRAASSRENGGRIHNDLTFMMIVRLLFAFGEHTVRRAGAVE